jgi:hypothetical protein
MIRPAYILCAQNVAIDQFTNGVILFNILESVPLPAFPFWIPSVHVVSTIRRDDGDPDVLDGDLNDLARLRATVTAEIAMRY